MFWQGTGAKISRRMPEMPLHLGAGARDQAGAYNFADLQCTGHGMHELRLKIAIERPGRVEHDAELIVGKADWHKPA